ncbi:Dimerisation domain-containing protein [Actinopolyspora mzabensis]|uniref:Dimerisation domain-containing protein n=1 Tax=Actinopolyspora mzabensis TaxID=995066 RepID=A0A1G8Y3X9_ACTMZ|nr:methyltransferase [Actinopolyspora mzabensis]SDJ97569.1 Dimerisation domain-containing protein [Actinopolyspora mzabensis]
MADNGTVTLTEADYLRVLIHGSSAFELVHAGLELGMFEELEQHGGMRLDQVAVSLGIEEQPARILLLGLTSLRLLEKHEDHYVNSELARRKLLRSGERFLGPLIDVQAEIINPAIGDLTRSLTSNTNVGIRSIEGRGSTLYERLNGHPRLQNLFYRNMRDVTSYSFSRILDSYDFGSTSHVVSIGGGDGTDVIELAHRYPDIEITIFDQESVAPIAEKRVEDAGLENRVHFRSGDLIRDPIPEGCDTILYVHLFEIWSMRRNVDILRKCHAALPEDGVCLIYNFVSDDEGRGPLSAGLLSPYFLTLASGEGMVYSAQDMERAAMASGFSRVSRRSDLGFSHTLVVGKK